MSRRTGNRGLSAGAGKGSELPAGEPGFSAGAGKGSELPAGEPGFSAGAGKGSEPSAGAPDPGLSGRADRPVVGIDNGYMAGYRARFDEAGTDGRVRTGSLLRYAQDIAWRHSEELGFDRDWYTEQSRWWVVRSAELEVRTPVPMGRILRLATAVIGHRRIWAHRLRPEP
ncbi:MAG: acyl-ACP thioesterase domain-containing protein, partial [Chloroflexota bacterium]